MEWLVVSFPRGDGAIFYSKLLMDCKISVEHLIDSIYSFSHEDRDAGVWDARVWNSLTGPYSYNYESFCVRCSSDCAGNVPKVLGHFLYKSSQMKSMSLTYGTTAQIHTLQ